MTPAEQQTVFRQKLAESGLLPVLKAFLALIELEEINAVLTASRENIERHRDRAVMVSDIVEYLEGEKQL